MSDTQSPNGGTEFTAGLVLIDKPVGPTSFRMVQQVRRALQIKKVGHTGTLDPFASGLLIICIGRPATRLIPRLMLGDKLYEAEMRLGVETDTLDVEGRVVAEHQVPALDLTMVRACLDRFMGKQMQAPPAFSAVKHQGKPLYHYARNGVIIEKEPRPVQIDELSCTFLRGETMGIRVRCSKGTYIRTLAADIGKALGCGAHLTALRRLDNGPFSVSSAVSGALLADKDEARALLLAHAFGLAAIEQIINKEEAGNVSA
ncbi:MAG: tRNA pseudouridine(55) synthase TruB [Proteobacteria bacterium]|nr:tRNA pseudouridine(55) synthase TruB [Desulfobulbaceae bacterium]MBU4151906.1 tRNA pseudouridine(55) synthase TruB [Pseudomonadota bacterium]